MPIARIENNGNSVWGSLVFLHHKKELRFPHHIPSDEIFNYDPDPLIRFKCVVVTALTPAATIVRSIYGLAKAIFITLEEVYCYLDGQNPSPEFWEDIKDTLSDSTRAWYYGTLLTGCASSGVFFPFWARYHYGKLERELNRHSDGPHRDKFYLAPCFQRLCVLKQGDLQNHEQVSRRLARYLDLIDGLRTAFFNCDCHQLMLELRILRPASA